MTRNGGKANWKGFKNISKRWKELWAICQEAHADNDKHFLIFLWRKLDDYLFYAGYYETRLKLIHWAFNVSKQDEKVLPWIFLALGEGEYFLTENRTRAFNRYRKALYIFKRNKDQLGIGYSLYELARLYRHSNNNVKALQSLRKALRISNSRKDKTLKAYCLNNIGKIYLAKGNFRNAEKKFNQSLEHWKNIKDVAMIGVTYRNIMQVHIRDIKKAYSYYNKALKLYKKIATSLEIAELKFEMSKILFSFNRRSEAESLLREAEVTFINARAKTFTSRINNLKLQYALI